MSKTPRTDAFNEGGFSEVMETRTWEDFARELESENAEMADALNLAKDLQRRADIRRSITSRKSVKEGKPDRLAQQLEEAALTIIDLVNQVKEKDSYIKTIIEG